MNEAQSHLEIKLTGKDKNMRKVLVFSLISILTFCTPGCVTFRAPNYTAGKQSFIEGNYSQAYKQLYPAAQNGHPDAEYAVGYMYYYGLGVAQDKQAAIAWMQRAANQGQSQAINAVDSILNTGYTSTGQYTDGLSVPLSAASQAKSPQSTSIIRQKLARLLPSKPLKPVKLSSSADLTKTMIYRQQIAQAKMYPAK